MDNSRGKFEAWIKKETGFRLWRTKFPMTKPEDQAYADHSTNLAWLAWQASRKALVVELPDSISQHNMINGRPLPEAKSYDEAIEDCADAIRELGITIKQ